MPASLIKSTSRKIATNPLMACIWEAAGSHAQGYRSLLQNGTSLDSAGMDDLLAFLGECICILYCYQMTDKSFLTESATEVDRCGKELVSIDLPDGVVGTEFNLLAARTMTYVQANILLTGPYATPSEELFKRASSFQESLEAATTRWRTPAELLNIARSC